MTSPKKLGRRNVGILSYVTWMERPTKRWCPEWRHLKGTMKKRWRSEWRHEKRDPQRNVGVPLYGSGLFLIDISRIGVGTPLCRPDNAICNFFSIYHFSEHICSLYPDLSIPDVVQNVYHEKRRVPLSVRLAVTLYIRRVHSEVEKTSRPPHYWLYHEYVIIGDGGFPEFLPSSVDDKIYEEK